MGEGRTLWIPTRGDGRFRTRKLYRFEPNKHCFKAYYSLILQGFKLVFDHPFNAHPSPRHCPFIARQVKLRVKNWGKPCDLLPSVRVILHHSA